jgi:quercetin dioxygenase-like cupin family protein
MTNPADLPEFVREAFEDDADPAAAGPELARLDERFAALLAPQVPSDGARARLLSALEAPPLRYAPFFGRVATLFDLPEEAVEKELARLAEPRVWNFAGLPGIHNVEVRGGPRVSNAETLFVRFAPGTYFPLHRHTGLEQVFVLEGSYTDNHGVEHRAGEFREWPEGTEHSFRVAKSEVCIFASVVFGRRFDAWPLRALAKLLGR